MVIEEHARLEILLPNEQNWRHISENDIIQNSLSIAEKCMDDGSFMLGGVFSAQLSAKVKNSDKNIIYNKLASDVGNLGCKFSQILEVVNEILDDDKKIEFYDDTGIINYLPSGIGHCVLPPDMVGQISTRNPRNYASWLAEIACGFVYVDYSDGSAKLRKCHCQKNFELGQKITLPDGSISWITSIKWQFRGGYTLSCAGRDTRAKRSQAAKVKDLAYTKINRLQQQINDIQESISRVEE